jgi:2-polyprenyl-3-methyl-5-hydroxy-6-metoxy-1,4-benzoquinol methylase
LKVYKYFTEPKFHDAEFYKDREAADHIHEPGQRVRLLKTLADIQWLFDCDPKLKGVTDLGCGNGGLLWELGKRGITGKGYDLSPKAVEFAKEQYGVDASLLDFTQETDAVEFGDVIVLTETIEHLVDPKGLLAKLKNKSRWVVASVPAAENEKKHYEFHLWAWEPAAFVNMFIAMEYQPILHYVLPMISTQFLIARNNCE